MRFGFVGPSYTAQSSAIADEECINFFAETNESGGPYVLQQAYGGREGSPIKSYFGTPGQKTFVAFALVPRGSIKANGRVFVVAGTVLYEVFGNQSYVSRGNVVSDSNPASLAFNGIQILIVSGAHAYCFTLATNALLDVTDQLAGTPIQCDCSDTYFIVCFENSNKYQMSQVLDGTTWPGQLVNEVSVFSDNITSIIVNHRELWVYGQQRSQVFQDTGSAEIFDAIPGALLEQGCAATFSVTRLDNSVFWIGQDERGALVAWRSNGYTPSRISTYAVEVWLSQQTNVSSLVAYSYQDRGHLFWVLYVPGSDCTWVYDVGEGLWHKRAFWTPTGYEAHHSWNHVYAFGKHLVGDWKSGNLYEMSMDYYDDAGSLIRRMRRSPIISNEMDWIYIADLTVDFETGLGPQPPLFDGNNAPRPPQVMIRWSDDRGKRWSPQQLVNCGFVGDYKARVVLRRQGRTRYRVYELVVTDPIPWTIVDAYLRTANA